MIGAGLVGLAGAATYGAGSFPVGPTSALVNPDGSFRFPSTTVAALPTCAAASAGESFFVSDAQKYWDVATTSKSGVIYADTSSPASPGALVFCTINGSSGYLWTPVDMHAGAVAAR